MNRILEAIKRLLAKDLVKVFSLTSLATLVRMLTGLVSVKVVALLVGPSGMALIGQLTNVVGISQTVATGGIGAGVTALVSANKGDALRLRGYLSAALRITLVCTLLLAVVLIAGADWLARELLADGGYAWVLRVFGVTLVLYSLNSLMLSIINGFKEFNRFVRISIWNSVVGALFTVAMVFLWGVSGALLATVTFQSVVFFITLWMGRKAGWLTADNFRAAWSRAAGKGYLKYVLMAVVSVCCTQGTQLLLRGYVIVDISPTAAGVWEGINKLSGVWMSVITTSLSVWYLPRFAELDGASAIRREVAGGYRLFVPVFAVGFLLVYMLRRPIVCLLFSPEFLPMQELFGWQLGGDMVKVCAWILGYLVLAKGMIRTFVLLDLISAAVYLAAGYILLPVSGIAGLCQAALIEQSIYLILVALILHRQFVTKK